MKEIKQPNDILVATLVAPSASAMDLLRSDINIDNTSLLNPDEYKQTPFIKKHFTDENGVFNEAAFNKVYEMAASKYWELEDSKILKNLEDYLEHSTTSRYRPINGKVKDLTYKPETNKNNPLQQATSLTYFNEKSAPVITPEEAAQQGGIWDPETQTWLEGTAEDRSLSKKLFGQTLVYAQYEKDGYQANPITGEMGEHKKGEFITDANGQYFTEVLGKRDLGEKKVVASGDILTKENSFLNKLDFFDSDGYEKSIGGVAMKTIARIAPYVIPGFNLGYGGFVAAINMAAVLPTFYKSIEGLITGDNPSKLSDGATAMENWFRKFKPSMSHKGQQKFFSLESLGNLAADTFGQLHQQRAFAWLSTKIKPLPTDVRSVSGKALESMIKSQTKWSTALSLGYMGLTQAADVYNEALNAGYSKATAGIASLMSAGAMYGIMNINALGGLGNWFLDKTVGYHPEAVRRPIAKVAKNHFKEIEKAVQEIVTNPNAKKTLADVLSSFKVKAANALDDVFRLGAGNIAANMFTEGVEEVTEEAVQDAVKGIIDTMSWLGMTSKEGSFGGWQNVFSKDGMARYLSTFAGGAFGGAIFDLQNNVITPQMERWFRDPNYKSPRELEEKKDVIDIVLSGRTQEYIEELKSYKNLLSNKRAATGLIDADGKFHDLKAAGQKTQADMVVDTAIEEVQEIESFVRTYLRGKDFDFRNYDDAIQYALRDRFRQDLNLDKAFSYVREKLLNNITELKSLHDSLSGKKEALESEKKEGKIEEKEAEEIVATVEEKKTEDPKIKKESENLKNAFTKQLSKVRGFFTGKEYVQTFKELTKLDSLLNDKQFAKEHLQSLNLQDFYALHFKDMGPFDNLPEDSTDPHELTKKKIKQLYDIYQQQEWTMSDLQQLLPALAQLEDNVHSLIDGDLKAFATHQHKKLFVDAIKRGELDMSAMEAAINEWDDDLLFGANKPEGFDQMSDEQQEYYRKQQRQLIIRSGLAQVRPEGIASLIKAHPKAWTFQERYAFDYAKALIDNGIIDIQNWNDAQQKVIRELINYQAAVKRINVFTLDTVQDLIASVNTIISKGENSFVQRLQQLATTEEEDDDLEFEGLDTGVGTIEVNETADFSKVEMFKLDTLEDYIKNDEYIEAGTYNDIRELISIQMYTYLDKIFSAIKSTGLAAERYAEITSALKEGTEALAQNPIMAPTQWYRSAIARIKEFIAEVGEDESSPEAQQLFDALSWVIPGNDLSEVEVNMDTSLKALIQKAKDYETKFVTTEKIQTNPLVKALEKILVIRTGSKAGTAVMQWAVEKAMEISQGKADLDVVDFTEEELRSIQDAIKAISYLRGVITRGSVAFGLDEEGYGTNQLTVNYIKAWGKSQEWADQLLLLDKEDADYIGQLLTQAANKLKDLEQVKGEMTKSKTAQYDEMDETTQKKLKVFYSTLPTIRLFDTDYPLIKQEDIDQLNSKGLSDLDFVLHCKQIICQNLQALKKDPRIVSQASADKSVNQVIIDAIMDGIMQKDVDGNPNLDRVKSLLRSTELTIDAIKEDGEHVNVSQQWWMYQLIGLLQTSTKTAYTKIIEGLKENTEVYPRIDQIEAMERTVAWYYGTDDFDYFNSRLSELYNIYSETPLSKAGEGQVFTWDKAIVLKKSAILFGSGGAGKTLLIKLLKNTFGINIVGLAKSEKKAEDLKGFAGDNSHGMYTLIPNLKDGSEHYKKAEYDFKSALSVLPKDASFKSPDGIDIETVDNGDGTFTYTYKHDEFTLSIKYIEATKEFSGIKVDIKPEKMPDINKFTDGQVIVLDECTVLNNYEWAFFAAVAEVKNVKFLFLGDPYQQSDVVKYKKLAENKEDTHLMGMSRIYATYLPELRGSWRSDNSLTSYNSSSIREVLVSPSRQMYGSELDFQSNSWDSKIANDQLKICQLKKFKYSKSVDLDGYKFFGTHVTSDTNDIRETIDLINNSPSSKTVAVIINDTDDANTVKGELESLGLKTENVSFIKLKDVQGAEYDYTISYKLRKGGSNIDNLTKIYTEITRSKKGNLVIKVDDLSSTSTNDLFGSWELTKDEDVKSDVSKQDFAVSENKAKVEALESSISALPDVSIEVGTPSVTPTTITDDEKAKTMHESASVAAAIIETTAPDDKEEVPEETASTATPTLPGTRSSIAKNNKVTANLASKGFDDFVIDQGWYYPPGVDRGLIKGIRQNKPLSEDLNKILNDSTGNSAVDQGEFIQFLWLYKDYKNNKAKYKGNTPVEQALRRLDDANYVQSVSNDVDRYKAFIDALRDIILTHPGEEVWFIKSVYDPAIDYPLDKRQNTNPDRKILYRHAIPFQFGAANTQVFAFTVGTQGFTGYEDKGVVKQSSQTVYDTIIDKPLPAGTTQEIFRFRVKLDSTQASLQKKFLEGKFKGSHSLPPTVVGNSPFMPITSVRPLRLTSTDPNILANNKDVLQGLGLANGGSQLRYDRMTLEELLALGFEIVQDNKYYFTIPNVKESEAKKAFIKWYNSFRAEPLTEDGEKRIAPFYNQTWVVLKQKGSGIIFPMQLKHISSLHKSMTDAVHSKYAFTEFTEDKKKYKALNLYMHRKMLAGISKLLGLSDELTQLYREYWGDVNDAANPLYRKDAGKLRDEHVKKWEDLFKQLKDRASADSQLQSYVPAIERLTNSFMAYLTHMAASKSGIMDSKSKLPKDVAAKQKAFEHKSKIIRKSGNSREILGGDLDALITKLDQDLLPGFFYQTDIDINRSLIGTHAAEYVVEVDVENRNLMVNMHMLELIGSGSHAPTGTKTTTPSPPAPSPSPTPTPPSPKPITVPSVSKTGVPGDPSGSVYTSNGGTVSSMPEVGTIVKAGEVLFTVQNAAGSHEVKVSEDVLISEVYTVNGETLIDGAKILKTTKATTSTPPSPSLTGGLTVLPEEIKTKIKKAYKKEYSGNLSYQKILEALKTETTDGVIGIINLMWNEVRNNTEYINALKSDLKKSGISQELIDELCK